MKTKLGLVLIGLAALLLFSTTARADGDDCYRDHYRHYRHFDQNDRYYDRDRYAYYRHEYYEHHRRDRRNEDGLSFFFRF